MSDCFVMLTTSKGDRGDRMKNMRRCAKFFNTNCYPVHKDVPLLVFSEGEEDLLPEDRNKIGQWFDCEVQFRTVSLQIPEGLELPDPATWHRIKHHGVEYRGMCWFYTIGLGQILKDEFDFICRIDDDSYFLSEIKQNFFDRMREEDCWYAYRGLYPEPAHNCHRMVELLEYDGTNETGVDGLVPQKKITHAIFTNFSVYRRAIYDHPLYTDYLDKPEVQKQIWTHRWGDNATQTALLGRAPEGFVRLWTDFKYGHGPIGPRYHMALEDGPKFWQPHRWPADNDGNIKEGGAARRGQRPAKANGKPLPLDQRNKALVIIGDGLGNVIAQTPLVRAAASMFKETHVWMPRSRPDIPDVVRGIPGVHSANKEWIDAFNNPDAIFQTWLVASQGNGKMKHVKARYGSGHPRGKKMSEAEVCFQAAVQAGYEGEMPEPFVGFDEWPNVNDCTNEGPIFGFTTGRLHRPMWRFKEYPADSYAEVVSILAAKYPKAQFLQLGWEHDTKIPHDAVRDTRKRGTLRQSLGLVNACSVFCGNDTGLCWAANAMKVPTVVVFGPTDPVKALPPWGAVMVSAGLDCQPCQWRGMGKQHDKTTECKHACMKQLLPSVVAEAIIKEFEANHAQTT